MNVLLFTHSQDIDGMGCAVLGELAFSNITVLPTKTFDITLNVKKYIDKNLTHYDKVFVTDLCIKEPVLTEIENNEMLKKKIIVLDHHKSEIEEGNDKYDFVHIIVEKNGRRESGTSLFYGYLLENGYLKKATILDELVEWTRQYDVWDWKRENNEKARYLHILFELLGYEKYVEIMNRKVKTMPHLEFDEGEMKLVNHFLENMEKDIQGYLETMKIVSLQIQNEDYKIGYLYCPYKYRNDVNEIAQQKGYEIDLVGMIVPEMDSVSYRQIKNVDVSIVATYFGGKGHFSSGSNPIANEEFQKMLKENGIKEKQLIKRSSL